MELSLLKKVRNFSLLLSILVFINILFGPLVRATNSGLACPDWPLCYGRVLPPAEFRIWMEVGHRFYSGGIGIILLFLGITILKNPYLRNKFGFIIIFSSAVILLQVTLGALTVTKLLDPTTVNLHLLNAVLFLLTVVGIFLRSQSFLQNQEGRSSSYGSLLSAGGILGVIIFFLVYYQLYMGGRVSSNYAGLACPDWPLCQGNWIPKPFAGPVRYHVEHRFTAYFLLLLILMKFTHAFLNKQNKNDLLFSTLLLFFCSLQILIGVYNVLWGIPTLLTAIHTANGVALLLCSFFVVYNSFTSSEALNLQK